MKKFSLAVLTLVLVASTAGAYETTAQDDAAFQLGLTRELHLPVNTPIVPRGWVDEPVDCASGFEIGGWECQITICGPFRGCDDPLSVLCTKEGKRISFPRRRLVPKGARCV